jgi:hypothetical protein
MTVGSQHHVPAALLVVQGAGGAPRASGQVQKILPPPGFNPWTVQPVASCCADCALRACQYMMMYCNLMHIEGLGNEF